MHLYSFISALAGAAVFACAHTECHADPAAKQNAALVIPLEKIMTPLVNYHSFRMKAEAFDQLVAPYCKKTFSEVEAVVVTAEYSCSKETGIAQIKIDARQNAKSGSNHMAYVVMFLSWDSYFPLKRHMEDQLGRPSTNGKDYVTWKYIGDKKLNALGTPLFQLSRDPSDKTTTFQFGIEQGP
jgi:hypothetical protein